MSKKNISKEKIQDRICQMIYRAETFSKWSDELYVLYEKKREKYRKNIKKLNEFYGKPVTVSIVLHHVLYFQEVILILNTLFERKRKPSEISFCYYFENTQKSDFEKRIEKISEKYDKSSLKKIRNTIFAHKQIDKVGDPITGFLNPLNKRFVKKAYSIICELKELIHKNFSCASNNYFEDLYGPAFNTLYESFKSQLNDQN